MIHMYDVPEGYKEIAQSTDRVESVYMSLGVDIDNTAADEITGYASVALPMSNTNQLIDAMYEIDRELATYEADGIPTAENAGMIVPPVSPTREVRTGWWSEAVSDEDGNIDVSITVSFSNVHSSALTIYTDGPSILQGSVSFTYNGQTETVAITDHNGRAVASGNHQYTSITISVSKIDQPYRHLRIAEFEFGDSITISTLTVANEITYIDEIDPFQQGLPMRELDFDLINVNGEYDEDNPNTVYQRLAIGNPINLSYTLYGNGTRHTIPMGRFVIAEKRSNGNCISVTAYDTRWYLSQMYNSWSLATNQSLGTALDNLLTSVEMAHTISQAVYDIYPTGNHTFSTDSTVLEDIMEVLQAYGLTFIPNRVGTVIIDTDFASDDYGLIPPTIQFEWPTPNQMNRYNYIDVIYGQGNHYIRDLRPTANQARVVLSVNNSLVNTEAQAMEICNRLVSRIYDKSMNIKWASDPIIDLGDTVGVYSIWTLNDTPTTYRALKREITFNGMLTEDTTLVQ